MVDDAEPTAGGVRMVPDERRGMSHGIRGRPSPTVIRKAGYHPHKL